MKIENHNTDPSKLMMILSEKELEYLKIEIGKHDPPENSALYYHLGLSYSAVIDIEMLPFLMTEIEFLYQDKITLCRLYGLLKVELLNNKYIRKHYEDEIIHYE